MKRLNVLLAVFAVLMIASSAIADEKIKKPLAGEPLSAK